MYGVVFYGRRRAELRLTPRDVIASGSLPTPSNPKQPHESPHHSTPPFNPRVQPHQTSHAPPHQTSHAPPRQPLNIGPSQAFVRMREFNPAFGRLGAAASLKCHWPVLARWRTTTTGRPPASPSARGPESTRYAHTCLPSALGCLHVHGPARNIYILISTTEKVTS